MKGELACVAGAIFYRRIILFKYSREASTMVLAATGMSTSKSRPKQRNNHRFTSTCLNNPAIKISHQLRRLKVSELLVKPDFHQQKI